jgi:hypothetical protein
MGVIAKLLIGLVLAIGSLWWIFYARSFSYYLSEYLGITIAEGTALYDLLAVLSGTIPAFVCLIGVFITWLEYDEWKIERELAKEEKKAKRRRKKR